MKTFFEKLLIQFEIVTHPAGGWFKAGEMQQKRRSSKTQASTVPSPDCFNVRGRNPKKGVYLRRTPAP